MTITKGISKLSRRPYSLLSIKNESYPSTKHMGSNSLERKSQCVECCS